MTVHLVRLLGPLRQTLSSTNAMESANFGCMGIPRRVCDFMNGAMMPRYAAADFLRRRAVSTGSRGSGRFLFCNPLLSD